MQLTTTKKAKVTNFSYLLLIVGIPFFFFILTAIASAFNETVATFFMILTGISLVIIVLSLIVLIIFFGKRIKCKRLDEYLKNQSWKMPSISDLYKPTNKMQKPFFYDLIDLANARGWTVKEISNTEITIEGTEIVPFKFFASYYTERKSKGGIRHVQDMYLVFEVSKTLDFYLCQGNLPGWFGEKIIKIPHNELKDVTAIGQDTDEVRDIILSNKQHIERLFHDLGLITEITFANGEMTVEIESDTNAQGDTLLEEIIKLSAQLVRK